MYVYMNTVWNKHVIALLL